MCAAITTAIATVTHPPQGLYITKSVYPVKCASSECSKTLGCQSCLIAEIDRPQNGTPGWSNALDRLTQHYGARYDYKSRSLSYDVGPLASSKAIMRVAMDITPCLRTLSGNDKVEFTQAIINNYVARQRITAHTDAKCFGPIIITVSLGSPMTMVMSRSGYEPFSVILEGGDIVALTGEARSQWKHELLPDSSQGFRRISLTYRTIN